jgi:hypothetical protein
VSSLLLQPLRDLNRGEGENSLYKENEREERAEINMEKRRLRREDRKMRKMNRGRGASMDKLRLT